MERGSSKHSPHVDEDMREEVSAHTRGGAGGSRTDEWREPEPAGEDQPEPTLIPGGPRPGGAPEPLTAAEVEERSQLGRWLPRSALPARRDGLLAAARDAQAPEEVLADLRRLPPDREFATVAQIWAALGHHNEERRW
jgi:Protein of unknown function (DUF2795)